MAYTTPVDVITGELATASVQNAQVLENIRVLRAGGIAIPSQAALDFVYPSSATQLARLAVGTAGQAVRKNIANNAYEFYTPGSMEYPLLNAITISANVLTVDLAAAAAFSFTMNANITTTTIQNLAAAGRHKTITMVITGNGTGYTWTWFASTVIWAGGTAPTSTSTNAKVDVFTFLFLPSGTVYGFAVGQNL